MGKTGAERLKRIGWAMGKMEFTAASRTVGETVSGSFEITSSNLGQLNL